MCVCVFKHRLAGKRMKMENEKGKYRGIVSRFFENYKIICQFWNLNIIYSLRVFWTFVQHLPQTKGMINSILISLFFKNWKIIFI